MKSTRLKTSLVILCVCAFAGLFLADGCSDQFISGIGSVFGGATAAPTPLPTEAATQAPAAATPEPQTPSPTPSPKPTPTPTPLPTPTPDPDAQYYSDKETVLADQKKGHWSYKSPTLSVDIVRLTQAKPKLVYFVADIRTRDPEQLRTFSLGRSRYQPRVIAQKCKVVIGVTADFMYDPDVDMEGKYKKGIIIRDGKLKFDRKGPADTLAILPGGVFRIYKRGETTPKQLIASGVKNAFSFGPGLVRDGAEMPDLQKHPLKNRNPRTGVGMVAPGHYIFIVASGRLSYSRGIMLGDFAKLFLKYGCTQAYNFDGGQSASMCFMGKQINPEIETQNQRRIPELFGLGTSELVK